MRFDVQHPSADPAWTPAIISPDAVTRFARATEQAGFASLGFTDHPGPSATWINSGGEGSADPFSSLGFCAAVTSTVRLFTWVLVLPYRNPFVTAHQTATLDALSGGRLTLGLGTGYLRGEFRAVGADFERRRDAFDEAVEVMRAAWAGEEITRDGLSFTAKATHPQPLPVQPGGPKLWVHGNSRWGRERAARYGQGWIALCAAGQLSRTIRTAPIPDLDDLSRKIDELRELTVAAGRDPAAVEVIATGNWPMFDARKGWDSGWLADSVGELEKRGVDRTVVVICGDDPGAAEDTVRRLGEELAGGQESTEGRS